MKLQYRYLAKERLAKAIELLKTGAEDDLTYACLELRKCIEALSYELFMGYLDEVPLKAFEAWQPDKVMKELLKIDPQADQSSRIRTRREGRDGEPDGKWNVVGEDRRLKSQWVTKSYHQLGNFLHVPTIKQTRETNTVDAAVVRARAEEIRSELARVLDTTIWNANFSVFVTVNCTECESPIKRRSSILETGKPVECGNCGQIFDVERKPDDSFFFVPASYNWDCETCKEPNTIVQSKVRNGLDVCCPKCGDRAKLISEEVWNVVRQPGKIAESAPASV
jgi:hypothetical protein